MSKSKNISSKEVLDKMKKTEALFSALYFKYSRLFPNSNFWYQLSKEEAEHGEWIEALSESNDTLGLLVDEKSIQVIDRFNASIEIEIDTATEQNVASALEKAFRLENSFLEKRFFDLFGGHGDKYLQVVERLVVETKRHMEKVRIEKEKYQ